MAACDSRSPTAPVEPQIFMAKGGGSSNGDPTVTSTDPEGAPRDTTLDVKAFGSGYDRGSRVDLALDGVVTDKVTTNSTRFVSSSQLVANITIAPDAVEDLYDVIVTTSRGKRGIGSELFAVADRFIVTMTRPADTLSDPNWIGWLTDPECNGLGYIEAEPRPGQKILKAGSISNPGPDVNLKLVNTGATWRRTYDAGRTLGEDSPEPNFSPFDGCYGETYPDLATGNLGFSGSLFMFFETQKNQPTVRFIWHFDYFNPPGTDPFENLTLRTAKIPVAAPWNGGSASIRVRGLFDVGHNGDFTFKRANEPGTIPFDFILNIEPKLAGGS